MAAVANQVHSTAQQIGAWVRWNPIDAATQPRMLRALLPAAGLVFVLLFGNAGWALVGFTCAGAGLATIIPNTFAAAGNIEGSAPGPSLAVVTTAGYVGFLAGPALIGFVAQLSTIRAALWIRVVLRRRLKRWAWANHH